MVGKRFQQPAYLANIKYNHSPCSIDAEIARIHVRLSERQTLAKNAYID